MKFSKSLVFKVAFIFFIVCCVLLIVKLQFENNSLQNQNSEIDQKIEEANENLEKIKRLYEDPVNNSYIEKYAKENYKMRRPDEIIFYNID